MADRKWKWNCAGKFATANSCFGPSTLRCGSCGATNYCSRLHQMAHWEEHKKECARMAQQMTRCDLHDFPFSFTEEVTQLMDEGVITTCSFLNERELHLKGLWQGECKCADSIFSSCSSSEWRLPSSMCPCTDKQHSNTVLALENEADAAESAEEPLKDWKDYYSWRHLPFDSPVALLLHWPLTLYHALGLVSKNMLEIKMKLGNRIHVHYLGPEKELQILQVFAELMALLPDTHVYIDMIGPAVPESRDGEVVELSEYPKCSDAHCPCKSGRGERLQSSDKEVKSKHMSSSHVTIKLWKGLYHHRYLDLISAPYFVLAPNAGITAFPSWQPTIKLLSESETPAIFTDYCEEAGNIAAHVMLLTHPDRLTYPVQVNPFRQPLCPQDKLLNLPTYSNAFIFGIN